MGNSRVRRSWAPLVIVSASLPFTAAPAAAQSVPPLPQRSYLRDSSQVAALACDIAAATRPETVPTRCHVETFRETPAEFIVRVRETPAGATPSLEFPRSEVRLQKDTKAVLTRMPDL